jgi:hypothetical protein
VATFEILPDRVRVRFGAVLVEFPDTPRNWARFWRVVLQAHRELGGDRPPEEDGG